MVSNSFVISSDNLIQVVVSDPAPVEVTVSETPTNVSIIEVLGPSGRRGSYWFDGVGPPADEIDGQLDGDWYLNISTGDVWLLSAGVWELQGSIKGPPGIDVGGAIFSEVLSSSAQDGVNVIFPLSQVAKHPASIQVFRNGLLEVFGVGFTATSSQITFTSPPLVSDVISLSYQI